MFLDYANRSCQSAGVGRQAQVPGPQHARMNHNVLIVLSVFVFTVNTAFGQTRQSDIRSLITQVESGDMGQRINAARALGQLGDKRAVDPLVACLRDTQTRNPILKMTVAEALGDIGDARAVEPLIACLNNTNQTSRSVKGTIIESLGKIGDPRAVDPLIPCLRGERPICLKETIKALGQIGDNAPNTLLNLVLVQDLL